MSQSERLLSSITRTTKTSHISTTSSPYLHQLFTIPPLRHNQQNATTTTLSSQTSFPLFDPASVSTNMRKLQASLTLRSLRHGKESTNALLLDDDDDDDDMASGVPSSSLDNSSSHKSSHKSSFEPPLSPHKKVINKVRSVTSSLGRRRVAAAVSASNEAKAPLSPMRTVSDSTASTVCSTQSKRSVGSANMGMMFLSDMDGADDFFQHHRRVCRENNKTEETTPAASPKKTKKRTITPFRNRERTDNANATPLTPRRTAKQSIRNIDRPRTPGRRPNQNTSQDKLSTSLHASPTNHRSKTMTSNRAKQQVMDVAVHNTSKDDHNAESTASDSFVQLVLETAEIDTSSPLERMVIPSPPKTEETTTATSSPSRTQRRSQTPARVHGTSTSPTRVAAANTMSPTRSIEGRYVSPTKRQQQRPRTAFRTTTDATQNASAKPSSTDCSPNIDNSCILTRLTKESTHDNGATRSKSTGRTISQQVVASPFRVKSSTRSKSTDRAAPTVPMLASPLHDTKRRGGAD